MIEKPADVAANPVKSRIWDEVTKGRNFTDRDVPTLKLLCMWHAIADQCMDDLDIDGELRVAFVNKMDDLKAMPQIATLKQASAEIRALNAQLKIDDEAKPAGKVTTLSVIQGRRKVREAAAQA